MNIVNSIMILFAIYTFAVSSGVIAEKTGQLNIAINGMMLFGALFGVFGYVMMNTYGPKDNSAVYKDIFSLLFACVGGFLGSLLLSFATLKVKADAGIAGTGINILAPIVLLVLGQSKTLETKEYINNAKQFQVNVTKYDNFNYLYFAIVILTIVVIGILWFVFKKTRWGFRAEVLGDNHVAAGISGVNVNRQRFVAMSISGILAGVAGGIVVIYKSGTLGSDVSGIGFIALCMIAISGWKIPFIPIVTVVVGVLFALTSYYTLQATSIPREVFEIIPFILPLIILPLFSKKNKAPRMIGIPYESDRR